MTTDDKRPDPRPVDPDIAAAWRTLPRDEPPPALDAAIRAAARRAVGARPERVREATRPERWWWPLAAAATIGAITIGILQIGGQEPRDAMRSEPAVISDMAPQSGAGTQKPAADAQSAAQKAPAAEAPAAEAPAARATKPATPPAPVPQSPSSMGQPRASMAQAPAPTRKDAASSGAAAFAPAPPAAPPEAPARERAATESRALEAGRIERAPQESATPADERRAPAANPFPAAPPSAAPPPASISAEPSDAGRAARVSEPFPAGGAAPAPPPASTPKASALSAEKSSATSRGPSAVPLSTADWIALIRRLRVEGRIEEAARELAAFRATHPEHARELPPDLRDWHPSAPGDEGPAPR